jgi:hypothetical protein
MSLRKIIGFGLLGNLLKTTSLNYFILTDTLNLYLLDVVSGSMVFSIVHKRTKGPVHVVHSENWLVYSYFNEKSRRTEIATLELYEGKTQSNITGIQF